MICISVMSSHSLCRNFCVRACFFEINDSLFKSSHQFLLQKHLEGKVWHVFKIAFIQLCHDAFVFIRWVRYYNTCANLQWSYLLDSFILLFVPGDNRKSPVVLFWPVSTNYNSCANPFWNPYYVLDSPRYIGLEANNFLIWTNLFQGLDRLPRLPIQAIFCCAPDHLRAWFR